MSNNGTDLFNLLSSNQSKQDPHTEGQGKCFKLGAKESGYICK